MAHLNPLPSARPTRFTVDPDESAVLIEARSTVGKIEFGTKAVYGHLDAVEHDGMLLVDPAPTAEISVDLRHLHSGNRVYDAELAQRLDTRRYPTARVDLRETVLVGDRYQVTGAITLHGETRMIPGALSATMVDDGWIVEGDDVLDIRSFEIEVPTVLMLRIFPEVRVRMVIKLTPDVSTGRGDGEDG